MTSIEMEEEAASRREVNHKIAMERLKQRVKDYLGHLVFMLFALWGILILYIWGICTMMYPLPGMVVLFGITVAAIGAKALMEKE